MASNTKSFPKQIIGSFEDIGKDVLKQTAQIPKDIAGKSLETFVGQYASGNSPRPFVEQTNRPPTPLDDIDKVGDLSTKRSMARNVLEYLAAQTPKPKELSVWERLQKEMKEKKDFERQQAVQISRQELPKTGFKRSAGDLYGRKAKIGAAEKGRNIRSD